jgi:type VI secretion system secreted protein VgrG
MAKISRQTDKLFFKLSGPEASELRCLGARVRDQLSTIPEMRMEFFSISSSFDPATLLGTRLTLEAENGFKFSGVCISVEDLGHQDEIDLFAAEIRPWPWLLTIGSDNRVFQNLTVVQIIKEVFAAEKYSTDVTDSTKSTYEKREYCVQFGESNFDFISRLMEEEGIYYYFDHSGAVEKLVLADGVSGHSNKGKVPFSTGNAVGERQVKSNSVYEWSELGRVVSGKVSLFDYDMTKPSADLKVQSAGPAGGKKEMEVERYQSIGRYKSAAQGEAAARRQLESHQANSARSRGLTNSATVVSGAIFTLAHEDRPAVDGDYLVTRAVHYMFFNPGFTAENKKSVARSSERIDYPEEMGLFETEFDVQKSAVQFRPPTITAWPQIPSLMTGIVTGPSGEEIYTDDYGRIRVQFPWDRNGTGRETSSWWVRTVVPWGGKDWGMFSVPRIGMEVVIQFENGNIDRPYCTGVVYNSINTPPYKVPDEATKTGIRTNSSKGGGGFHELTFEDKKGEESIFFQSEKDYKQIIKNNAEITIGMEKKDKGDLTQTIYRHKTETLKEGDLTLTVEKGNRITKIKTDDTETIEGKSTTEITGDTALTIKTGNKTEKISTGNSTIELSSGNLETLVKMGNVTIDASLGKITISAMQEIELKVGANSIKIGPAGVTVSGTMVTLDGTAMTEVKGPVVMVKGSGLTQISGGVVMVG